MKTIAFVAYPGLNPLDLVGPLQVLSALAATRPDFEVVVVAERLGTLETDTPLSVSPSHTFAQVPAPHVLVVPGGTAPTLRALTNRTLLDYLHSATTLTASVCTGSLLLGAAGLLDGREATTHWAFLPLLAEFGATPVSRRWVEDGPILTAAGVSAGIGMALHLAARFAGDEAARSVQFAIEYDPEPAAGPLDWASAPRQTWAGHAATILNTALADHAPDLHTRLAGRL